MSNLEKQITIFPGHAQKSGATREKLDAIIKTLDLIRKYLPFYKNEKAL